MFDIEDHAQWVWVWSRTIAVMWCCKQNAKNDSDKVGRSIYVAI